MDSALPRSCMLHFHWKLSYGWKHLFTCLQGRFIEKRKQLEPLQGPPLQGSLQGSQILRCMMFIPFRRPLWRRVTPRDKSSMGRPGPCWDLKGLWHCPSTRDSPLSTCTGAEWQGLRGLPAFGVLKIKCLKYLTALGWVFFCWLFFFFLEGLTASLDTIHISYNSLF